MRKLLIAALLVVPVAALAGTPQTIVLDVQNMTCALCPVTVKKALQKVPGVAETKINFDTKTATVKFDPDKASVTTLVKATTDAGYPASPHK